MSEKAINNMIKYNVIDRLNRCINHKLTISTQARLYCKVAYIEERGSHSNDKNGFDTQVPQSLSKTIGPILYCLVSSNVARESPVQILINQ